MVPADKGRVVITGSEGFIGSQLRRVLVEQGYDVYGIDCIDKPESKVFKADLLDGGETARAVNACRPFSVLIHTAALAHGQKIKAGDSYERINFNMTENVLKALESLDVQFIFFSSVAVYGEDKRSEAVSVKGDLRPSTDYGKSKLACEKLLLGSDLKKVKILRLAPVFDQDHLKDVRKRVFLPGPLPIKMRFIPSPTYSLCHVDTVVNLVLNMINGTDQTGDQIRNVTDSNIYNQQELLSWFPGRGVTLPTFLFKPIYLLTYLLPRRVGYSLRCAYWKLIRSNVYI
jgi:nucleoside-diphosphate-sugar epimerase